MGIANAAWEPEDIELEGQAATARRDEARDNSGGISDECSHRVGEDDGGSEEEEEEAGSGLVISNGKDFRRSGPTAAMIVAAVGDAGGEASIVASIQNLKAVVVQEKSEEPVAAQRTMDCANYYIGTRRAHGEHVTYVTSGADVTHTRRPPNQRGCILKLEALGHGFLDSVEKSKDTVNATSQWQR
ncbi:hypothetical protein C8R45DRAFT_946776 [Mycena sanguinolenta]|nr:hypothetical protein C8R45DRAFT_946776 [Mycena sanguinolenta]